MVTISTGIDELDKMLSGGLKTNYCYAIEGTAGAGKTVLSLYIAKGALKDNIPVVFITTEVEKEKIIEYAKSLKLDFESYIKRGILIIEKMRLIPKRTVVVQTNRFDLSGIILRTKNFIQKIKAKVVIFDSISAFLADFTHKESARNNCIDFIQEIISEDVALILTNEFTGGQKDVSFEEFLVDGVIRIITQWENNQLIKLISVPKLRSMKTIHRENRFVITEEGIKILPSEHEPIYKLEDLEPTGIEQLDELLGGGIEKGAVVLIETNGETFYLPFMLTTFYNYLHKGKGIIIHSNVQMYPTKLIAELKKASCSIDKHLTDGNVVFIDKYNRSVTAIEAREISEMMNIEDMISITSEMIQAFQSNNQEVVLYGDLTDDSNILSERDFLKYFALQSFYVKEQKGIYYAFINYNAVSREILARIRTNADIILKFKKDGNQYTLECIKTTSGATFLPRLVRFRKTMPLVELVD